MAKFHAASGALLIIDQEPIRRQAVGDLQDAYDSMRKMRKQLDAFESVDKPAFARWLRTEFHEQLVDISRLQSKVADSEEIASAIQMVRFATGCSYYQAYLNIMERRRMGESLDDFAGSYGGEEFDSDDDLGSTFEEETAASGKKGRGKKASASDDHDGGKSAEQESASDDSTESAGPRFESKDEPDEDDDGLLGQLRRAARGTVDLVKQRYRELARLLHPDLRSGGDSWTNELWLRTQEAYQSGDIDELDNILVLCRVSFAGETSASSTISDMKAALVFVRKSVVALRRQISQLREDMAWGFSRMKDKTRLRRRISYDLDYEHEELTSRLEELEGQLARWSVPPARGSSRSGRGKRSRSSSWDLDFDF